MRLRSDYIKEKIKWFHKNNPKMFHQEITRQLYELYAPLINDMDDIHFIQYGGKHIKDHEFKQEFDGYIFKVVIEQTKYDIMINILTHKEDNPLDCAIINIDRNKDIAYISNTSYYDDCMKEIKPGYVKRKSGSIILKYILNLLKTNKDKFGINRIALKDNSIKVCSNCFDNIRLSDMYFLLYGNTW